MNKNLMHTKMNSHLKKDTLGYYLHQELLKRAEQNYGWSSKGSLYAIADQQEYSPEYAGRELRKLAKENIIYVDYYKGKRGQTLARYRVDPPPKKQEIKYVYDEINNIMKQILT